MNQLNRRILRQIESDLKIYIDEPLFYNRNLYKQQQFGIYDADENYLFDLSSKNEFFTENELRLKIKSFKEIEELMKNS